MRGIFFIPSPTANLVGVVKKTLKIITFSGAILCVLRILLVFQQIKQKTSVFSREKSSAASAELFTYKKSDLLPVGRNCSHPGRPDDFQRYLIIFVKNNFAWFFAPWKIDRKGLDSLAQV